MNINMILILIISTILSFSCTKETPAELPAHTVTAVPQSLNKTKMLQLVNKMRQQGCQCGSTYYSPVAPLTWNDQLEVAALAHSKDMQAKKYFSHTSPDGSGAGDRIERAGYNWMAFGENIGQGYKDEEEVVAAWKSSPSHCKNIMDGKFKEMGVAKAGEYWTQTFGAR